jgi:NAD(P)H-dependent flavin oxidoreductase YrpB (nitropropane dioxygenase family)
VAPFELCAQAGMGVYVSNYRLAHAVASEGDAIGMVSGVAMDNILARVLQVILFHYVQAATCSPPVCWQLLTKGCTGSER